MFRTRDSVGSFPWEAGPEDLDHPLALGAQPRTRRDLLADAAAVADRLGAAGARTLMLACRDRYHVAAGLLGAWATGGVAVLPSNLRADTVQDQARRAGADLVLSDDGSLGQDLRQVLDGRPARSAPAPAAIPGRRPVAVVFTSGSSGQSVACAKTADQLLGEAVFLARFFRFTRETRVLATAPPHHLYGLLFGVLAPLIGGSAFIRSSSPLPGGIAGLARAFRPTILCAVPAHLEGVTSLDPDDLATVETVFCSGGVLDERTRRELTRFPFSIVEIFGSSESGGIAFRDPRTTTAWRPFEGITVAADDQGRLLLDSPFLPPDGPRPFPCADLVAIDEDGTFQHGGRADSVVKIGGERVSVAEIEQRLRSVPGVSDAAVRAIATGGARQWELWAAVVAPDLTEASIRAALSSSLDTVAIPRRILFESALPREDSGKLVHDRFVALFGSQPATPVTIEPVG